MGAYSRGRLGALVGSEKSELERKAGKKSLWGSIGRTIGGLGAMAVTGGAVNPLTLGLVTGGASFLGGAVGARAAGGKLTGGRFFKSDRAELQKELGAFGSANITESLKAGVKAGIGQKLKLMKDKVSGAKLSEGFGMDFKKSMVGKGLGLESRAIGRELIKEGEASLGTKSTWAEGGRGGMTLPDGRTIGSADLPRGKFAPGDITAKVELGEQASLAGKQASLDDFVTRRTDFASEFGEGGGATRGLQRMRVATDVPEFSPQMPTDPSSEFGAGGGRMTGPTLSMPAYSQGTFYEKQWRGGHPMSGMSTSIYGKGK